MIDRTHLPGLRWAILRTAMVGGHIGCTDRMALDVVRAGYLGVELREVRDEIAYLADRRLVAVRRSDSAPWRLTLTRHGRDLVDYTVDCQAGIARPPRLHADG